jgi:hypothetical protein
MFDICATFILGRAYESFPVPAEVDMSTLYKDICNRFNDISLEEGWNALSVITSSIEWLRSYGYLTYQGEDNNVARNVLLTEKGLRALRSVPRSLDIERETVGDVLVAAGKEGTKEAVLRGIGVLFGGFATGLQ